MLDNLKLESAEEVRAYAGQRGFVVSLRQLKRWHYDGLIPRPNQEHAAGIPGSTSWYPSGTGNQLCRLCEIHKTFRKAEHCGKTLWWLGFPVTAQYGRDALNQRAVQHGKIMPRLIALVLGPTNDKTKSLSLTLNLKLVRTTDKVFGALRRRVGTNFPDFMNFIAVLLEGDFDNRWSSRVDDEDIAQERLTIDRAFGLWRAKNLADVMRRPELHSDVEKIFGMLSDRLGRVDLTEVLADCSDSDVQIARNQLCTIFFASSGFVEDQSNRKLKMGLKVLSIFHRYASFALRETMLLYLLALKEEDDFKSNVTRLMEVFRDYVPNYITYEQLTHFRLREPAIAQAVWGDQS